MSRHTPVDRFTLPKDISGDIPESFSGEIPSPTDPRWRQPGGFDPREPAPALSDAAEAARGYVMRSAAGRGWAPAAPDPAPVVMVHGLPHTAEDLALLAQGEGAHPAATKPAPKQVRAVQSLAPLPQAVGDKASATETPLPQPPASAGAGIGAGGGRSPQQASKPGPAPLLTPDKQAAFCSALAEHGNVRLACRAVQVSAQTAYRARRASWPFRQCWDAALVLARDHAEQVLADRALNGVEEKVFYHGEEVATRTRYSDRLLLAHLARLDKRAEAREVCEDCHAPLLGEDDFDEAVEALGEGEGEAGEADGVFASGQCSMCSRFASEAGVQDTPPVPLEQRLTAMQASLPPGAQAQSGMSDREWRWAEPERLCAFEAGEDDWWLARAEEVNARED